MPTPIHAAARRLRGHLVATPLIGGVFLPGTLERPSVKTECLQVGGTVMFRGYQHFLLRSLGRLKGVVLHGDAREVLAQFEAAVHHRQAMRLAWPGELPAALRLRLGAVAGDVDGRGPEDLARETGFHVLPGLEDQDVLHGVATLGLELAQELPSDIEVVQVSPAALARPIGRGLRAGGHAAVVQGSSDLEVPEEVRCATRDVLRVHADDAGLAALAAFCAAPRPRTCVVLSC